ncbi:MAG: rod shape-determining protein MreC [Balneolaceae bacterium]
MQFKLVKVGEAKDFILTAILLLLAISIAISRGQNGINSLRQVSITAVSLIQTPLSQVRVYRQALNTNTYLQRQNILLQDELSKLRSIEQENLNLRNMFGFTEQTTLDLIPVTIVGKELNGINNSLTIKPGLSGGLTTDMPLITSNGLLGKVVLITDKYAQIMPYFNTLFKVSAKVQENQAPGIVSWEGTNMNELVMDFVPLTIKVDSGYVIETSGFSNQYPEGIPIGVVTRTEAEEGKETQKIYLKPFASLFDVSQGFVVRFEPDSSLNHLRQKYNEIFK